jgi:prephenate dehydrogenase
MGSIAIIGLGRTGASLGLALTRATGGKGPEVVGFDPRREAAQWAKRVGAATRLAPDAASAVTGAEIVFLTVSVVTMRETLTEIARGTAPGCVVTDTASTKARVLEWAEEILPEGVSFVGGHPLLQASGDEPLAPDPDLFQGRTYCLLPGKKTAPEAVDQVAGIARAVGATPFFIDAEEHDAFVAAVEILPLLLSCALTSVTTKAPSWREMSRFVTDRYRELTGVASFDPQVEADTSRTAESAVTRWLDEYIDELRRYRGLLAAEGAGLAEALGEGRRPAEGAAPVQGEATDGGASLSLGSRFTSLLIGERLARKAQQIVNPGRKPDER